MANRIIETDDGWGIALTDAQVSYIHIDFRLGLDISDSTATLKLVLATPFRLQTLNGDFTVDPENVTTVSQVLLFFNSGVDEIGIGRNGDLNVHFSDGSQMIVGPNDQYEAWQIACENEFLIVCQPEGLVSIFERPTSERSDVNPI